MKKNKKSLLWCCYFSWLTITYET